MSVLLYRLLTLLNDEEYGTTDHYITTVMINNFGILSTLQIKQLADLCNVSPSKISKFIRKIGFEDYNQFKLEASFKSKKQEQSRFPHIVDYIEENGYHDYFSRVIEDIKRLDCIINFGTLKELAKEIYEHSEVAVFGLMHSEHAALQLQTKLAYYGKYVFTQVNDFKQEQYIKNASKDTLIIIFSDSGNFINTYQISEGNMKKKTFLDTKAKIILITSNNSYFNPDQIHLIVNYQYTSNIHSYGVLYSMITDLIVYEYKKLLDYL